VLIEETSNESTHARAERPGARQPGQEAGFPPAIAGSIGLSSLPPPCACPFPVRGKLARASIRLARFAEAISSTSAASPSNNHRGSS